MKRYALALCLALATPAALAQEHGEQGHGELDPAQGGFHAPEGNFNLSDPSPAPTTVEHAGVTRELKSPPPFLLGPVFNFAILLVLGYMAIRRQVNPALAARRAAVETEIAEAKRLHDDAQAMHREYTERLDNLKTEIDALRADLVKQGEAERDRIIAEAQTRAEKMRAEGTQVIESEMRQVREDLRREAVLAAVSAAEEAVKKNINPSDQSRLVDDFIHAIEGDAKARAAKGASA